MYFQSTDYVTKAGWRRTRRQLGNDLTDEERINAGIGPKLAITETFDLDPHVQNTFCDSMNFTLAGNEQTKYLSFVTKKVSNTIGTPNF